MKIKTYEIDEISDELLIIAMIVAKYKGKRVYVRHKDRTTYEIPGGHREPNETIEECAKRELMEETGATNFTIKPLFVLGVEKEGLEDYGQVFMAEIEEFSDKLEYEMEEVVFLDGEPMEYTYPDIQAEIIKRLKQETEIFGVNQPLQKQIKVLQCILEKNQSLYQIIKEVSKYNLPNYYVGGGAITQTVWNYLLDKPLNHGISDVDIVYYDTDLSEEKESAIINTVKNNFTLNEYDIDVANESRIHLWYEEAFGKKINAYKSVEEAISTWPTTATSIGVRLEEEELIVFAPYGMNDLFKGIVRPNKLMIDEAVYNDKVTKWRGKWRELNYLKW